MSSHVFFTVASPVDADGHHPLLNKPSISASSSAPIRGVALGVIIHDARVLIDVVVQNFKAGAGL